ncbi:TetR/AcrR family transcriptional regulator [Actinocorallia populi]|uniref:TetR/AcrR family transcriptional regulator n=1 Tax=Actinocorallia populi TaxID=2079200 RepID=UPI000D088EA5|nr:TetR/AcrR family transcriptional regulator [Actinocorallia populi]
MNDEQAKLIIWARPPRSSRGPRPAFTLEGIARAAVALCDAEGLDALTMRRLAAELGTGTMSLYRYVQTKNDLVDLMVDLTLEEIGRPAHPDWRTGLSWLARQIRARALRHPWIVQVDAPYFFLGPNGIEYVEYLYGIVDGIGLGIDEMMRAVNLVAVYAEGAVRGELAAVRRAAEAGCTEDEWMRAHGPHFHSLMATGRYPLMHRVMLEAEQPHMTPEENFEHGLQRVLDGIEDWLPGPRARERR